MTWIQTHSGIAFDLLDPKPEQFHIEDIAHALSNLCRFNGHCSRFYSVLEHSLNVAEVFCGDIADFDMEWDEMRVRFALLHDGAEAYTGDVTRPLKRSLPEFADIERRIHNRMLCQLQIFPDAKAVSRVKFADDQMLATEWRDLMGPPPRELLSLPEPLAMPIGPQPTAEWLIDEFLKAFHNPNTLWKQCRES
ncbi:MAG: hypothetical protein WC378_00285 [Opitutaceae bacterium]|jgi:hypothetical protein